MPAHDIDELRIALRGPYGRKMTGRPDCKSDQPKTQAETEGGRESAIEDRNRTRRAAEQDMFGQGAVHRHRKTRHLCSMVGRHRHQTSAPPPKEKKERKKLDARSEEHTSELQSLMRISYAVFCLKQKKTDKSNHRYTQRSEKTRK